MRLENLMENKPLDFNQPFLSVRRVSSIEASSKANERRKTDTPRPSLPVYKPELKSGPVRNPGNVPFLWEQAPGRPKDERKSQAIVPKPPSGISSNLNHQHRPITQTPSDHFPSDKKVAKFETLREKIERDLNSSSEDGDEAYFESVDAISRTESFFMNCSVTGLSGVDGADAKPSRSLSTDQQTRDFMLGRFLPAAVAMASETPQVANRKQKREAKKVAEVDKQPQVNPRPTTVAYSAQKDCEEESEFEDNDVDVNGSDYSSSRDCGLFTRFCLKGSLCLLNPVSGMRMQGLQISSAHGLQNDNSIDDSCSHGSDQQKLDKSSSSTHLKRNDTSNNRDNPKIPRRSRALEGRVFPSVQATVKNSKVHSEPPATGRSKRSKFRELLADESWAAGPVVEKTLYVDSVRPSNVEDECKRSRSRSKSVESMDSCFLSCSGRSSYDAKLDLKASGLELDHDGVALAKAKVADQRSINFERKQLERSGNEDRSSKEESFVCCFQDFDSLTSSKPSDRQKFELIPLRSSKATAEGKIDLESNPSSLPRILLQLPLAPPLPKSPSESWLKRTLPTVSSRNSSLRSTLAARIYATRQSTEL